MGAADCAFSRKLSCVAFITFYFSADRVSPGGAVLDVLAVIGRLLTSGRCLARRQAGLVRILSRPVAARLDSADAGKAKLADGF